MCRAAATNSPERSTHSRQLGSRSRDGWRLTQGHRRGASPTYSCVAALPRVIAVDVGYGQLAWSIRQDPRVTVLDRTNVRELTAEQLPGAPDLVVGDLSFISLGLVLPAIAAVVTAEADLVLMVKPQFEVGKERLGKGGVVRDPALRLDAIGQVAGHAAKSRLWSPRGVCESAAGTVGKRRVLPLAAPRRTRVRRRSRRTRRRMTDLNETLGE